MYFFVEKLWQTLREYKLNFKQGAGRKKDEMAAVEIDFLSFEHFKSFFEGLKKTLNKKFSKNIQILFVKPKFNQQ